MNDVYLMVVDGIRGLKMSPLVEFEPAPTPTLTQNSLDRPKCSMAPLRHLDDSRADAMVSEVILEILLLFVTPGCVVG